MYSGIKCIINEKTFFVDTGLSWGLMHNLLSNPNQLPIDNYRRIQSTEYSRPGDLALSRILDLKGFDTVVPLIEDWNLLVKRPLNVIDRIGQHTGNVIFRDSYECR